MQRYKKIARDCAGADIEYLSDMTVTTVPDPCAVQKVEVCPSGTAVPVDVLNCDNTTTTLNTEAGDAKRVVISGVEGAIKVCIDDPKDVAATQKCDVNTGNTILIRSVYNDETNLWEVPTYFDLVTGADWTGNPATDLIECSDVDTESDPLIGCDGGLPVTQWVVKTNGQPTGVVYYTDATGAIVTPVAWTPGACSTASVQIVEQNLIPVEANGIPVGATVKEVRTYTNGVLTATDYFDTVTGAAVTLPAGTVQLVEEQSIQKEPIEMCDNGVTFLRHFGYSYGLGNSVMGYTDTDKFGAPYTASGAETIGACSVVPAQTTMLSGGYSIANGTWTGTLGPDGTNWSNPGNLRSVTVRARKGSNTDAIVGNGNQVVIVTSLNKYVLFPEDGAVTYSVEDGNIQDISGVNADGDAAALVIVNTL
jgi:hypothetical protein